MDEPPHPPAPIRDSSDEASGNTALLRPKGKWATAEEWTAARPTIKKLYMEDNVPLKEVMSIMETQHNLYGTIKMYKNKLNEWGFFKTFKPREVLDALRILEAREAEGEQNPKLTMRGNEVDVNWIRDYIKRNRKRINKINRKQVEVNGSNSGKNLMADMMDMVSGAVSSGSSHTSPKLSLQSPERIRQAEELLIAMSVYVDSAMSRGLWFVDCTGYYRSKKGGTGNYYLYDLWDRLDNASQAMTRSEKIDLVSLLNPAFAHLNDIVREEDPRSLPFLLGCFEILRIRGRSDLMETFLKYIWQLSSTLLGTHYPHSRIWKQAYYMFRSGHQQELIDQIFLLLMDRYHSQGTTIAIPGGVNPYSTKCGAALNQGYKKHLEELELTIRAQLDRIETQDKCFEAHAAMLLVKPPVNDEDRDQLATLRDQYASAVRELLRRQGQHREAEEALAVLRYLHESGTDINTDQPALPRLQPDKALSLRNIAEAKLQAGDTLGAEHFYRVANHLNDNPSIYRDEIWINWIFEGMANVMGGHTQGKDRERELRQLRESRSARLEKERAEYHAATAAAAALGSKDRVEEGRRMIKNIKICAGAGGVGCPKGAPAANCPYAEMLSGEQQSQQSI